jgi:hypothetical protein
MSVLYEAMLGEVGAGEKLSDIVRSHKASLAALCGDAPSQLAGIIALERLLAGEQQGCIGVDISSICQNRLYVGEATAGG